MAKDRNVPLGIGLLGGNAKVYNTIAEMQQDSKLKVGKVVEILGYYQAGDGAGHKRVIADSDDGSGVSLENGLYANIVHNGEVNVSWFGAKGDGVTDDGDIIKKTLDYANTKNIDITFTSDKRYYITKEIVFNKGVDFNNCTIVIVQKSLTDFGKLYFYGESTSVSGVSLTVDDVNNKDFSKLKPYGRCLVDIRSNDEFLRRAGYDNPVYKDEYIYVDDDNNSYYQTFTDHTSFGNVYIYRIDDTIKMIKNLKLQITLFNDDSHNYSNPIFKLWNFHNAILDNISVEFTNNDVSNNPISIFDISSCYKPKLSNMICSPLLKTREGTYVVQAGKCVKLHFDNVYFNTDNPELYWGATGTNLIKDWIIEDSNVSRMDSHTFAGGNFIIKNSEVNDIRLMGKHNLIVENSEIGTISFRSDFNSYFDGDIIINNSVLKSRVLYIACYDNFSENITNINKLSLENCKLALKDKQVIVSISSTSSTRPYAIPKNITIKNTYHSINKYGILFFKSSSVTSQCNISDVKIEIEMSNVIINTGNKESVVGAKHFVKLKKLNNFTASTKYINEADVYCDECNIIGIDNIEGNVNTKSYLSFNNCRLTPKAVISFVPKSSWQIANNNYIKFINCLFDLPSDLDTNNYEEYKNGSLMFFNKNVLNTELSLKNFEFENCNYSQEAINFFENHSDDPTYSTMINDLYTGENSFNQFRLRWFSRKLYEQITGTLATLNTPTMQYAMELEGIKQDYLDYSLEKFKYDKQLEAEQQAKYEAYELLLKENTELTWEELEQTYGNTSMMNLNLVERLEEPQIPESVVKFMEKYLGTTPKVETKSTPKTFSFDEVDKLNDTLKKL